MFTVTIIAVPLMVLAAAIPVVVGIYVYRDARSRGMNPVLWTLVAMLTPSLIGFIIFLLVRGSYSNLTCPGCGERVQEQYAVCPACGAKLKAVCGSCGRPAEEGWKVCPHCAAPLTEQEDVTPPLRRQDRTLGKILLAVVLIPLALLISICVFGMVFYAGVYDAGGYGVSTTTMSAEEGERTPGVGRWMAQCRNGANDDPKAEKGQPRAYALRYRKGENGANYLFYCPAGGDPEAEVESGFRSETLRVDLSGDSDRSDRELLAVSVDGVTPGKVKTVLDGKEIVCNIQDVNFDPCASVLTD